MEKNPGLSTDSWTITFMLLIIFSLVSAHASCQVTTAVDSVSVLPARRQPSATNAQESKQYDLANLVHHLFHPHDKPDSSRRRSGINIVPNISSNPSIGQQIGIKAVVGRVLGSDPKTYLSVAATSASITTKNIVYFYLYHNVFTNSNQWNLTGIIAAGKVVVPDYGLGIGSNSAQANPLLNDPARRTYGLKGQLYTIREKIYKQIKKNLYAGAGLSFDTRRNLENLGSPGIITPYDIYTVQHGFNRDNYRSNGILLDLQYITRDNQNRSYKGIYFDLGLRSNQTWLGSSRSANQLTYDFRKYFSLSKVNPEHVLAFWNWGSYLLGGNLPYLDLPGTQKDPSLRSGRGYTVGYFKGTQYNDMEVEYRFPVTRNKFISGVVFFNEQTANDDTGTKIFQIWQPGGGAGLRVLFNKVTRTNLCLDYAFGKFGKKGFFLGLNEAF
jgi:hypothetical protein